MENYVFEMSKDDLKDENLFDNVQWVNINDNNNATYSNGQIRYQLSSIYNNNMVIDWYESYLNIPLKFTLTSSVDLSTNNVYSNVFALKSLYHIINNVNLIVNGKTISNNSNNFYEFLLFESLTKNNRSNFDVLDPNLNINLDGDFLNPATSNFVFSKKTNDEKLYSQFKEKSVIDFFNTKENNHNPFYEKTGNNIITYNFVVQIKLRNLHSFFENCGLIRCFVDQLNIDLNIGTSIFTNKQISSKKFVVSDLSGSILNTMSKDNVPFFVNPNNLDTSNNLIADATLSMKLEIGNKFLNNSSIYAKLIKYTPTIENLMLENENREFYYLDCFKNETLISAGTSINFSVTNSQQNIKYVLIIPHYKLASVSHKGNPFLSYTTANYCALDNLNLLIGGKTIQPNPINYNYQAFNNNLLKISNPHLLHCISQNMFNLNHRYYYFDCEEIDGSNQGISKSINLICTNNNTYNIDAQIYVVFSNYIKMNKLNGAILDKQ